jgi:hypothetical protein
MWDYSIALTQGDQDDDHSEVVPDLVEANSPLCSDCLVDFLVYLLSLGMHEAACDEDHPETCEECGDCADHELLRFLCPCG